MPTTIAVVFLSAFLLFLIQPLISRYVLPWFGGAPSVWSAALLFFQVLLLIGYGYAHFISAARRRSAWHLLSLTGSLLGLLAALFAWGSPLLPGQAWRPEGSSAPILAIFGVLLVSISFPFTVLASTSPLLQSWAARLDPGRSPYRLYAWSNLGSFLALLSYPLFFEPLLSLRAQAWTWSAAYLIFAGLCASLAIKINRLERHKPPSTLPLPPDSAAKDIPRSPFPLFQPILWIAFPACASVLLLAITNQLTQEVAVIPFLWVLPLGIYLLSFAITFSGERAYPRIPLLMLLGAATLLLSTAVHYLESMGILLQIAIYSLFLLTASIVCHGELYRLRPEPERLTSFYFLVSLGGVVGGAFVNFLAPLIFNGYWELHGGVLLCWALVLAVLVADRGSPFYSRWIWAAAPAIILVVGVAAAVFTAKIQATQQGVLEIDRNFYGVYRVRALAAGEPPARANSLSHGITSHGFQFVEPEKRRIPTSYYGKKSGIGLALIQSPTLREPTGTGHGMRLGIIGLGTGTLAAYAGAGDRLRFYEINPAVIDLALGRGGYFTYLKDTPAAVEIVPGDARLSLERELAAGQTQYFDLLAVDAFNSDSIPVHLLTREAFAVYLAHLRPGGILALHISNRYLDLGPLVQAQAELYGLGLARIASGRAADGSSPSVWVLLSTDPAFFEIPAISVARSPLLEPASHLRPWTDDYSNLLPYLRLGLSWNLR